jgi:copper chaperone NosL
MRIISILALMLSITSCSVEPEPLRYGEDACHHCRMTLVDKKFGAELVTRKGKVYKFDDVNCMISFYNSGEVAHDQFLHKLVVNFSEPANLIEADKAFYLKSTKLQSPMGGQVAAFETDQQMKSGKDQLGGIYMVWGELVTQFK